MANSLDQKFIETSESIIAKLGFKDIRSFVKQQASLLILAKIDKYESENTFFERKYKTSFEEFQERRKGKEGKEVYEEEDDYLDWRFARESLNHLREQKQELDHA
ncbi:MAG: hypothetical protein AB1512_11050 [Thermodesulfobacteriota bacterium]